MIRVAWVTNLALLAGSWAWCLVDGRCRATIEGLLDDAGRAVAERRGALVALAAAVALLSWGGVVLGCVRGSKSERSLRRWFALVAVTASWLALGTTWRETHWRGQSFRLASLAPAVDRWADQLVEAWPQEDGALAELGDFSAYPIGRPSTLMLLASPKLPNSTIPLAAVHRGEANVVRFQLGGSETGAWLERWPGGSGPADFEDGLQEVHRLERSTSLGNGWYAVRYGLFDGLQGEGGPINGQPAPAPSRP